MNYLVDRDAWEGNMNYFFVLVFYILALHALITYFLVTTLTT